MIRRSVSDNVDQFFTADAIKKFNISLDLKTLLELYRDTFIKDLYPGLGINPVDAVSYLSSENPDQLLRSDASVKGYDPCAEIIGNATAAGRKKRQRRVHPLIILHL